MVTQHAHTVARNVASVQAIPPEYITPPLRATYAARAQAGEDVYAYAGVTTWIVWDGAIAPDAERRIVLTRREDMLCGCCGLWRCDCGAWRCVRCGRCLKSEHCRCAADRSR